RSWISTPARAGACANGEGRLPGPDLDERGEDALERVVRARRSALVAWRPLPEAIDPEPRGDARVHEVTGPVRVLVGRRDHLDVVELPDRLLHRHGPVGEIALLWAPARPGP